MSDYHTNRTWSIDAEGHLVKVTRWFLSPDVETGMDSDVEYLAPTTVLEYAEALVRSAKHALANQITDLRRGECGTCHNVRMIDDPIHDGVRNLITCPDCPPGWIPTIPGRVQIERELLR